MTRVTLVMGKNGKGWGGNWGRGGAKGGKGDVEGEGGRRGSWVWEGVEGRPALVIALKSSTFAVRFAPANRLIKAAVGGVQAAFIIG